LLFADAAFWSGCFFLYRKESLRLAERASRWGESAKRKAGKNPILQEVEKHARNRKRNVRERELSECLAYMQNIVALGRGLCMSGELLLAELADISDSLQSVFWEMAHRLRLCDPASAEEVFCSALEQDYARDVAKLLIEWERISPAELTSTVEAYRNLLLQRRRTRQKNRDEWISDLAYFPVVVNAMAVLLNFIYVAYFIEQRDSLTGIL
jgi:hypothetical protein